MGTVCCVASFVTCDSCELCCVKKDMRVLEMEAMSFGEAFDTAMDVRGKTVYSCRLCGRPFKNYSNLKRHIKLHDPIQESFPCRLCSRKYGRKDTLKWHLKQAHGIISIPIDACDKG
ncbi:unnamed protein product [Ixodes pacificus]